MKLLTVSALLCALMALTSSAAALSSADSEEEGSTPTENTFPRPYGCAYGWTQHENRCFRYISTPMSWAKAERNCLSLGGNLASVQEYWGYFAIQELTAPYNYPPTWIGGTDAPQNKIWFWSDGSPFRYSYWCSGEPSNDYAQHCLQINYSDAKCWDDVRCSTHLPSVCARKM